MKIKLKIKLALVLSASILINIFLIWEVFRLRKENSKLSRSSSPDSQSLEELWEANQPPEKKGD
ncbi:MAG: hypothetical protein ACJZ72_11085 [Opitutales bacterium]